MPVDIQNGSDAPLTSSCHRNNRRQMRGSAEGVGGRTLPETMSAKLSCVHVQHCYFFFQVRVQDAICNFVCKIVAMIAGGKFFL